MTLTWSKTPPDKPGWWWMRVHGDTVVARVREANHFGRQGLYALVYGSWVRLSDWWGNDSGAEWAGPIPEPQKAALMAAEGGA